MIYFAEAVGVGNIKIGHTDHDDALIRVAELQTGSPVPLRLLGVIPGTMADEKDLHRRFASARVHGEWFRPVPELLSLIPAAERRVNGSTEVVTRSVQIKVLTVGRRQFSKALLNQLPVGHPFNDMDLWHELFEAGDPLHAALFLRLALRPECDYWGWVEDGARRLMLHQENGVLTACSSYKGKIPVCLLTERISYADANTSRERSVEKRQNDAVNLALDAIWERCRHEWLSEQHHLYVGV